MTYSNRVTAAQWCGRLAQIQCAAEALCCTDTVHRFATVTECESSQRNICETNFRVATIGADARVAYSLDGAETSLTTFENMTLQCDVDAAAWGASPDGLITMFAGTRGSGQSCTPTSMTDFAAGASCTRGSTCIPTSSLLLSWNCSARSGSGGPCFADVNCNPDLHCASPETRSTCVSNLNDGAGCSRATECTSLFCEGGACVPRTVNAGYCFKR